MKIGYAYWGFLGDIKLDENLRQVSTPDGNAFYSWAIIYDLIKNGHEVVKVMPDRDESGYKVYCEDLFASFAKSKRNKAYKDSSSIPYPESIAGMTLDDVFSLWDAKGLRECDQFLLEWRMLIPGRNDLDSKEEPGWQPDLFIQNCLIRYCVKYQIQLTVFDLDYKLDPVVAEAMANCIEGFRVFELGDKWSTEHKNIPAETVAIPFDFSEIYTYKPKLKSKVKLVYVGNRYERDWCIDKYIPKNEKGVEVYGNWLESGRDSAFRWPSVDFKHRINASEMPEVYQNAATTILLAKKDYCKYHFMTARLLEAAFYGTVPLFIEEYGKKYIRELIGPLTSTLVVSSEEQVIKMMNNFAAEPRGKVWVVNALREELKSTFDVSNFTAVLLGKSKKQWKRSSRKTAYEYEREVMFRPLEFWNGKI